MKRSVPQGCKPNAGSSSTAPGRPPNGGCHGHLPKPARSRRSSSHAPGCSRTNKDGVGNAFVRDPAGASPDVVRTCTASCRSPRSGCSPLRPRRSPALIRECQSPPAGPAWSNCSAIAGSSAGLSPVGYTYAPPPGCHGPWAKVVLRLDLSGSRWAYAAGPPCGSVACPCSREPCLTSTATPAGTPSVT